MTWLRWPAAGPATGARCSPSAWPPRTGSARALAEPWSTRTRPFRLSLGPVDAGERRRARRSPARCPEPSPRASTRSRSSARDGSGAATDYLSDGLQRTLRKSANRLGKDGHTMSVAVHP